MTTYTYRRDFTNFINMMNAQLELAATGVSSSVTEEISIDFAAPLDVYQKQNLDDYMLVKGFVFVP